MPNLQSKERGGIYRGLFVGPSGTGKTVAAASFPGPIKIYDFDDNIDSLLTFYPTRDDIEYITVTATDANRKDTITLVEFLNEFFALRNRCDYETVVLDSLTQMSQCIFHYILHVNGELLFKKGNLPTVNLRDYQKETATMLTVMETIKALPCHVIATSHPITKTEMDEPGELESMRTTRSLTGYGTKTPSFIPNYFTEMYWFYNEVVSQLGQKPKRKICTVANGEIPSKTALPLPPIIDVTDKPLYNVIEKAISEFGIKVETARQKGVAKTT